jgi:hypothetical protein
MGSDNVLSGGKECKLAQGIIRVAEAGFLLTDKTVSVRVDTFWKKKNITYPFCDNDGLCDLVV